MTANIPWFDISTLIFRSLILTLAKIIFSNFCTCNCAQKIFDENFLWLKTFESNLKLCCSNFFLWPMANDLNMDSIDIWFFMLWKDMKVPLKVKLEQKPCGKENFDEKWRVTVYNWMKVK